jgi:hypothetical protein
MIVVTVAAVSPLPETDSNLERPIAPPPPKFRLWINLRSIQSVHTFWDFEKFIAAVGIAVRCGLNGRSVRIWIPVRTRYFSSLCGGGATQPRIQWVPGAVPPVLKRPGREAHHSPPASAEVKNTWICTFTSSYAFMLKAKRQIYPCNRPWKSIGFTFSRQSAHRWRWGCQPYAPAALYPREDSLYSFLLRGWVDPVTKSGIEPATFGL